ncbi:hypothetical protein H839_11019 [Parageobacillus genomosp. 1]|uniref:PD-(D/E)XK endonuclease-like domain-containing protein n=1 Tax=Parageobacillus genomosp. 1 TaxID=1295642 RepID=A0ABC9VC16_9BACL|nr:hypothetical protein [Parageobacillus genomosp. 1]EZP75801.1 hypothetical protein H839_11019 [Parageobacillus genomosp. 1]
MKLLYTPYSSNVEDYLINHVKEQIKNNPNYQLLHLTPTLILSTRRKQKYRYYLELRNNSGVLWKNHIKLNEFHHWLREHVYSNCLDFPISKSESHVLIRRAIRECFPNQIEWLSASSQLLEAFFQLQATELSINELQSISSYEDWKQVIRIYQKYLNLLEETKQKDFFQVYHQTLTHSSISCYSEVIFDGPFLFFNAEHEKIIKLFEEAGKPITFIVPYTPGNPAYKIIEKVYGHYVPIDEWKPLGHIDYISSNSLTLINKALFTNEAVFRPDDFKIRCHPSVEQEITHAILDIKNFNTKTNYQDLRKVAILTPNSVKLRPLVREIAEQLGLEVDVPPRPLLGLTTGEFIQMIYQIKIDERKFEEETFLSTSMFKKILTSYWFAETEETLAEFELIEDVFFVGVSSLAQWKEKLEQILEAKSDEKTLSSLSYHPLNSVKRESIEKWKDVINQLLVIQDRLFSIGKDSIGTHSRILMEEIDKIFNPSNFKDIEFAQELYERIKLVIKPLFNVNSLEIESEEFAEILSSLLVEQEEWPEGENKDRNQIMVTSLQNIVYQEYQHLFLIQFTQENYPSFEKNEWPLRREVLWKLLNKTTRLHIDSLYEYEKLLADRERYYFYLSFFSSKMTYTISYSKSAKGIPQYPSLYLYDLAKAFGIEEDFEDRKNGGIEKKLIELGILTPHSYEIVGQESVNSTVTYINEPEIDFKEISIEEIGIYKLCPKRFYYSIKESHLNVYSNLYLIGHYMSKILYTKAAEMLFTKYSGTILRDEVEYTPKKIELIKEAEDFVKEAHNAYKKVFPVNEQTVNLATYYAEIHLKKLIEDIWDRQHLQNIKKAGQSTVTIEFLPSKKEKEMTIEINGQSIKVRAERNLIVKRNNREYSFVTKHYKDFLNISTYVDGENEDKFNKWYSNLQKSIFYGDSKTHEITKILNDMFNKDFSKKAGVHCFYCPFKSICQGKDIVEEVMEDVNR